MNPNTTQSRLESSRPAGVRRRRLVGLVLGLLVVMGGVAASDCPVVQAKTRADHKRSPSYAAKLKARRALPSMSPILAAGALPSSWQRVVDGASGRGLMEGFWGAAKRTCLGCQMGAQNVDSPEDQDALQRLWLAQGITVYQLSTFQLGQAGLLRVTNLRPLSLLLSTDF
jgi:hypothetical protein